MYICIHIDTYSICIYTCLHEQVKLPDGRSLTVTPKLTDFRCSSDIILNTQLILSHGNWTGQYFNNYFICYYNY